MGSVAYRSATAWKKGCSPFVTPTNSLRGTRRKAPETRAFSVNVATGCAVLICGKRLTELLGRPSRCGMSPNRHVHDTASLVRQDDQHEEEPIRRGGRDEEICRHDLPDMIREKRAPCLGGRSSVPGQVLRHGSLTHVKCRASGVRRECAALPTTGWPPPWCESNVGPPREPWATQVASALPRPEEAEAATVPGQHRLWLDNHESIPPSVPDVR